MSIYPLNIFFILNAILLGTFCYNRFKAHLQSPYNKITFQYFLASFFVSIAMLIYGISVFFTKESYILSIFAGVALILNAIGFNHFLLLTLYDWFSPRHHLIARYSLHIFIAIITIFLIIEPPKTFLDMSNIIHWRFSPTLGIVAALHMDFIFGANIAILMRHFYRLKKLSIINSLALIFTFIFAGVSGSYLYVGDNSMGLLLAAAGLYLGISTIFFSVIHGFMNKVLD